MQLHLQQAYSYDICLLALQAYAIYDILTNT